MVCAVSAVGIVSVSWAQTCSWSAAGKQTTCNAAPLMARCPCTLGVRESQIAQNAFMFDYSSVPRLRLNIGSHMQRVATIAVNRHQITDLCRAASSVEMAQAL